MTAVWMFFRDELRRRWRSWLVLALVAGLVGGLVTTVAAGARRTDAAYPALEAWSRSPDDLISLTGTEGPTFASVQAAVARLPQVTDAAEVTSFSALEPAVVTVEAPTDGQVDGRPCSPSICRSASSSPPSTRRSATRRYPGCRARWPGGRVVRVRRAADRHQPRRRDLRGDRGTGSGPRRGGVHRRGARRVVAGARARRRHPGPGAAQHRALGPGHRRAGSGAVRGGRPRPPHRASSSGRGSRPPLAPRRPASQDRSLNGKR